MFIVYSFNQCTKVLSQTQTASLLCTCITSKGRTNGTFTKTYKNKCISIGRILIFTMHHIWGFVTWTLTEIVSTVSATQVSYKCFTKNKTKDTHTHTHTTTHKLLTTFRTFFCSKVNLIDLRWFRTFFCSKVTLIDLRWKHKSYGSSIYHIWCILCTQCTSDYYVYIRHNSQSVKLPGQVQNPQTLKSWLKFVKKLSRPWKQHIIFLKLSQTFKYWG